MNAIPSEDSGATPLPDEAQETFARLIAEGVGPRTAYLRLYSSPSLVAASVAASRLSRQPAIAQRIWALQQAAAEEAVWALTERLEYLRDAATTPYGAVDGASPLCVGSRHRSRGVEYRTPDKLDALALYSRLAGDLTAKAPEPPISLGSINLAYVRSVPDEGTPEHAAFVAGLTEEEAAQKEADRFAAFLATYRRPGSPLANARHERFAQLIARGESLEDARRLVYGRDTPWRGDGYRLAHEPHVATRIAELRSRAADLVGWTIPQRLLYLKRLVQTPYEQITPESWYCQGIRRHPTGLSVQIPSKLRALHLYTQLEAHHPPPCLPVS